MRELASRLCNHRRRQAHGVHRRAHGRAGRHAHSADRTGPKYLIGLPLSALGIAFFLSTGAGPAVAAQPPVELGTATSFAVLAGTAVTNTGPSTIAGNVGVSPGTAVTGFPPGHIISGTIHAANAVALQAQSDLTTAYNDAAGRGPAIDETGRDLGGQRLVAGIYGDSSGMALTGTVTLDAQGDPDAVFIFQAGSTLITASSSTVALVGGAQACHVYWQVSSSATLGVETTFVGNLMAHTSVSVQTGATVHGRILARNGQVSLDDNTITQATCAAPVPTATPSSTPTVPATSTPTPSPTPTAISTPTVSVTTTGTALPTSPASTPSDTPTSTSTADTPSGSTTPTQTPTSTPWTGSPTPHVPQGHPDTGRRPNVGTGDNPWLFAGLLCVTAAGGSVFTGMRLARSRRQP